MRAQNNAGNNLVITINCIYRVFETRLGTRCTVNITYILYETNWHDKQDLGEFIFKRIWTIILENQKKIRTWY